MASIVAPKKVVNGLEVLQASYGAQGNFQDVTKEIQGMVKDGNLNFTVSAQSIGILDPAPGVKKTFQIKTTTNGGSPVISSKDDGETLAISAPAVTQKKNRWHFASIYSGFGYGLVAVFVTYVAYSVYGLATYGLNNKILGVILALLSVVTLGHAGFFAIPFIVFIYALLWPQSMNLSYATGTNFDLADASAAIEKSFA